MIDDRFARACEVLGVRQDANRREIEQAYRARLALYREENLATYSLFSDDERDEQLDRIKEAYRELLETLGDVDETFDLESEAPADVEGADRGEADALGERDVPEGGRREAPAPAGGSKTGPSSFLPAPSASPGPSGAAAPHGSYRAAEGTGGGGGGAELGADDEDLPSKTPPSGGRESSEPPRFTGGESPGGHLKRCREALGLSISELSAETRIGSRHIEALEGDDLADLKALVYVRGFVTTLAKAVKAEPVDDVVEAFSEIFLSNE